MRLRNSLLCAMAGGFDYTFINLLELGRRTGVCARNCTQGGQNYETKKMHFQRKRESGKLCVHVYMHIRSCVIMGKIGSVLFERIALGFLRPANGTSLLVVSIQNKCMWIEIEEVFLFYNPNKEFIK